MRDYELIYIISPAIADELVGGVVERVTQFVTARGGTVVEVNPWGRRKLAYPIRNHSEGYYVQMQLHLEPQRTRELETSLEIAEDVLRHLLVKREV